MNYKGFQYLGSLSIHFLILSDLINNSEKFQSRIFQSNQNVVHD